MPALLSQLDPADSVTLQPPSTPRSGCSVVKEHGGRKHTGGCSYEPSGSASIGVHAMDHTRAADVQKHPEYFFMDGNAIFQVENTQYRVHRSLLERHSPVFRELFEVPQPLNSTEGLSDENPIFLAGVKASNFTCLLRLIYPSTLGSCSVTTVDEWTSIVDQADRWEMDDLRDYAVDQLRKMYIDPMKKIILWERYDLPGHELIPCYMEIISRPQSISLDEAHDIGLGAFVKVASAREIAHRKGVCGCCFTSKRRGYSAAVDAILCDIVKDVFGLSNPPASP